MGNNKKQDEALKGHRERECEGPTITTGALSDFLSLTKGRIAQLANDGIMIRVATGRYDQWASIQNYIHFLQDRQQKGPSDTKSEKQTDLKKEQLKKVSLECEKIDIQNRKARGELVELDDVKKLGQQVMSAVKSKIENLDLPDKEKDKVLADLFSLKTAQWGKIEKEEGEDE